MPRIPIPKLPPPGRIIRRLGRHPIAVVSIASFGLRVGKDAARARKGEIDGSEFRARTGGHAGSISGGIAGAMAGAVAMSVIPGLGPIIGGFAGGIIGEMGGSRAGRKMAEAGERIVKGFAPKRSEEETEEPTEDKDDTEQ